MEMSVVLPLLLVETAVSHSSAALVGQAMALRADYLQQQIPGPVAVVLAIHLFPVLLVGQVAELVDMLVNYYHHQQQPIPTQLVLVALVHPPLALSQRLVMAAQALSLLLNFTDDFSPIPPIT
jgi:hypothetical protein